MISGANGAGSVSRSVLLSVCLWTFPFKGRKEETQGDFFFLPASCAQEDEKGKWTEKGEEPTYIYHTLNDRLR